MIQACFQEQSLVKCWTLLHGFGVTIVNEGKLTMSGACYWCMLISSSRGAGKTICILVSKETKTCPWHMILVCVASALSLQGLDWTISKMRPYALWKWRFLTIERKTSSTSALCFQKWNMFYEHDLAKLYFHFHLWFTDAEYFICISIQKEFINKHSSISINFTVHYAASGWYDINFIRTSSHSENFKETNKEERRK